jgi:hypothetical protein
MTSKEKAEDLLNKMLFEIEYNCQPSLSKMIARECALIAADELEKQEAVLLGYEMVCSYSSEYWQEVKQEIKNSVN